MNIMSVNTFFIDIFWQKWH